jgi:nucleoside-diphosphate-sugar epimerase
LKILLTGANGFVGSHILDRLCAQSLRTAILLRPGSDTRFIRDRMPMIEVRHGSITDQATLEPAMAGVTHVIHCAGCIKAQPVSQFYEINQKGTRNVVEAVNSANGTVRRLLHISSLAAAGPAPASKPAREQDLPAPVSEYGRSKLAGEQEVRTHCRAEHIIVRPPAVYGPRDAGFLSIFKSIQRHVLPLPSRRQDLSLVFVRDLANAVLACLEHPAAAGKTYFVTSSQTVTGRHMAREIAAQMRVWTVPLPLSPLLLYPVCLAEELRARATGKARLLSLQKYAELRAPGWVCDPTLLRLEIGYECRTTLEQGVTETLEWYRREKWL